MLHQSPVYPGDRLFIWHAQLGETIDCLVKVVQCRDSAGGSRRAPAARADIHDDKAAGYGALGPSAASLLAVSRAPVVSHRGLGLPKEGQRKRRK